MPIDDVAGEPKGADTKTDSQSENPNLTEEKLRSISVITKRATEPTRAPPKSGYDPKPHYHRITLYK